MKDVALEDKCPRRPHLFQRHDVVAGRIGGRGTFTCARPRRSMLPSKLVRAPWEIFMLDKRIIVTGGSYGIGSNIIAALVAEGATVASMARSADKGEKLTKNLAAKGPGKIKFYKCDVSDRGQIKNAFAAAVKDMGGLDSLVHVAGVETGGGPEGETDEQWDYQFNVNAKGTFITNQEAFPYLKDKGGHILNFGSGTGVLGLPSAAGYSASKAAVALGAHRRPGLGQTQHHRERRVSDGCDAHVRSIPRPHDAGKTESPR